MKRYATNIGVRNQSNVYNHQTASPNWENIPVTQRKRSVREVFFYNCQHELTEYYGVVKVCNNLDKCSYDIHILKELEKDCRSLAYSTVENLNERMKHIDQ